MALCRERFIWKFELLQFLKQMMVIPSPFDARDFCPSPTSTIYSCCPLGTQLFHLSSSEAEIICVRSPLLNLFCETRSFTRHGEISVKCISCLLLFTPVYEQTGSSVWSVPNQRPKRAGCECLLLQQKGFFSIILKVFKVSSSQANFNLFFCSRQGKCLPLV